MTSRRTAPRPRPLWVSASLIMVSMAAAALLLLWATPHSSAATFTVTKTADTADGTCDADCSLREAITAANSLADADVIDVPAGTYTLSIPGAFDNSNATGDLDIGSGLTLNGAGSANTIIDGGALDRVFDIGQFFVSDSSFHATISGVTVRNGSASFGGAGITSGGGATVTVTTTLTNSTVSGNSGVGISVSS